MSNCCGNNYRPSYQQCVCIPLSYHNSVEGEYFVGQTENISFYQNVNGWAALVNPKDSGVNLFVNVYTISNFSTSPFLAKIYFNTNIPQDPMISDKVSPSNTTISTEPAVEIQYGKVIARLFSFEGVNPFDRIVPGSATLVSEEDGKFIIPPGGNFLISLSNNSQCELIKGRVAFGWWEEETHKC